MARMIKELDVEALRREILHRCKRDPEYLAPRAVEEDAQEEDVSTTKTDEEIAEEELPFEEILAEKRRGYTAKEEFIYSLYNSALPAFVAEWDGYFLRRKSLARRPSREDVDDDVIDEGGEEIGDREESVVSLSLKEKEEEKDAASSVPPWKISLPDEFADIRFYNNNAYSGRISRKMMEGEGTYTWHNGVQYKGEFEQNQIRGRGLLRWNDDLWYEGDFVDGFRHGKGVMTDREHNRTYVGQWHTGRIHTEKGKEREGRLKC